MAHTDVFVPQKRATRFLPSADLLDVIASLADRPAAQFLEEEEDPDAHA